MNCIRVSSVPLIVLACVVGCTNIDVKTDYDHNTDFTRIHTFAFAGMTDLNQDGLLSNSLTRKRVETAIARELTKKELRPVELDQKPDVLIHYWLGIKDKENVQAMAPMMTPAVGGYGWRGSYGYGAGYSGVTTYEFREGTLITDMVEPVKNELVWRATVVANLEDSALENIELTNKAILKAFEGYPPAGAQR